MQWLISSLIVFQLILSKVLSGQRKMSARATALLTAGRAGALAIPAWIWRPPYLDACARPHAAFSRNTVPTPSPTRPQPYSLRVAQPPLTGHHAILSTRYAGVFENAHHAPAVACRDGFQLATLIGGRLLGC
jgi:hypothetical protein